MKSLPHQIRQQLTLIQGGIETNNPELSKRAVRRLDALLYRIDALVRACGSCKLRGDSD